MSAVPLKIPLTVQRVNWLPCLSCVDFASEASSHRKSSLPWEAGRREQGQVLRQGSENATFSGHTIIAHLNIVVCSVCLHTDAHVHVCAI